MSETETYGIHPEVLKKPEQDTRFVARIMQMLEGYSFAAPNVFVIGGQKCGTTSLLRYLLDHEDVHIPRIKEFYFYSDDNVYDWGERWYHRWFDQEKRINIDGSANYFESPKAAERIRKRYSNAKIILLLRDPIERAYSHFQMNKKLGVEPLSFEEALKAEDDRICYGEEQLETLGHNYCLQRLGYRTKGCYANYLPPWLEHFGKDHLLILKSESFFSQPLETVRAVYEYLSLEFEEPEKAYWEKKGGHDDLDTAIKSELQDFYRSHNQKLSQLIGPEFSW